MRTASFEVWCVENGGTREDGRRIQARSAEDAAKIWAERDDADSADYLIVGGQPKAVTVIGPDGREQTFEVSGETRAFYRAREVA
jgi:hypothetical protein